MLGPVTVDYDAEDLTTLLSFIDYCLDTHLQDQKPDTQQVRLSLIETRNSMATKLIEFAGEECDIPKEYKQ